MAWKKATFIFNLKVLEIVKKFVPFFTFFTVKPTGCDAFYGLVVLFRTLSSVYVHVQPAPGDEPAHALRVGWLGSSAIYRLLEEHSMLDQTTPHLFSAVAGAINVRPMANGESRIFTDTPSAPLDRGLCGSFQLEPRTLRLELNFNDAFWLFFHMFRWLLIIRI